MKRKLGIMLLILSSAMMLGACSNTDKPQQDNPETESIVSAENNAVDDKTPSEGSNAVNNSAPSQDNNSVNDNSASEAAPTSSTVAETEAVPYYGTWSVKDCQPAKVSALSPEEIGTYLSYSITYQPYAVYQNDQKMNIDALQYESEPYTEESLVENYKANLGEWWNGISEVSCVSVTAPENFFGNQFFVVSDDTLWIYYEGAFFLAKKVIMPD